MTAETRGSARNRTPAQLPANASFAQSERPTDRQMEPSLPISQGLAFARDVARLDSLRRAYEHLVPTPLDIVSHATPTATVREATFLFTDVRGFTSIAEQLRAEPDRLLSILNEHFDVVVRTLSRSGGVVEKFLGDGVFASFGARADLPDHHLRAFASALAVVGANEALNRRRADQWGFRLEVAIGVASGRAVVGRVGPAERCEIGILGDPVNLAARLVASAGPAEILVPAAMHAAVARWVAGDLLPDQLVRGRVGPIDIFRLRLAIPRTVQQPPVEQEVLA